MGLGDRRRQQALSALASGDRWSRWMQVLLLLVAGALAYRTWLHSFDDAYITYTYARSLAGGLGLTWNGVEGLGTTSPLLAVLLAGLESLLPLGIPVWGHLVSWLAAWLTAIMLWRLGRSEGWPLAGAVAGIGWLLAPSTHLLLGSEFLVAIACIAGAAVAMRRSRTTAAAVGLALAVGLRAEMGLAAVILAAASQLTIAPMDRRELGRLATTALAFWSAWLVALWALAGTLMPSTLAAKRAQAASGAAGWAGGLTFLRRLVGSLDAPFYGAGLAIFATLALVGGCVLLSRSRRWPFALALTIWGPLHVVALALLDVPYYPWYSLPFHLSLLLAIALLLEGPLPQRLPPVARRYLYGIAAILLVGLFLLNSLPRLIRGLSDPRQIAYRSLAAWVSDRYPETTQMAFVETGYLGYFGRFRTLDLLGVAVGGAPLEAVADRDYPHVVETLAPDLLLLAQAMASTGGAIVDDPEAFLDRFTLDHAALDLWPHLYLYRDRTLPARGTVAVDLLAESAIRGPELAYRTCGGQGAVAGVLRPGEELRHPAAVDRGQRLFSLTAAGGPGPSTATIAIIARERVVRDTGSDSPAEWRRREIVWSHAATEASLVLRCEPVSESPCLMGLPHLVAAEPALVRQPAPP